MKKYIVLIVLLFAGFFVSSNYGGAQTIDREKLVNSLKTIDSSIVRYFPRWRICEPDLQVQITQTFKLFGYPADSLDMQNITITAAPKADPADPYTLLLIEDGSQKMVASEIDANMERLASIISGETIYSGPDRGLTNETGQRTYCYSEIPVEIPLSPAQKRVITNFLMPTDVTHSISLSVFEQALKIGQSGFWLRSMLGTDEVGYHFWSAGEAKVVLQRPLYQNADAATRRAIPYLINAHLGGGYRLTSGLDKESTIFKFVPTRRLNAGPGGKFVGGLDFYMPFHPQFGVGINMELPLQRLENEQVDPHKYATYPYTGIERLSEDTNVSSAQLVPILRSTGQATLFYHWWIDPETPEDYFRFDLGISYAEVREGAFLKNPSLDPAATYLTLEGIPGLHTYKPSEFGDWIYAKAEYRSQSVYPFGVSLQYSNQILLGHVYIPLLGQWLYIEGKYATPLRTARPFEVRNFFMISPILRLTI